MLNPNQNPETVRVKFDNDQGFCIINKDDFDAEKQVLFDAPEEPEAPVEQPTSEEAPAVKPAWQS